MRKFWGLWALLVWVASIHAAPPRSKVFGRLYIRKATYLWSEPTSFGKAQAKLSVGTPVEVVRGNSSKSWLKVQLANGRDGYVLKRNLSRSRPRLSNSKQQLSAKTQAAPRNPASPDSEPPPLLDDVPLAPDASGASGSNDPNSAVDAAEEAALQDAYSPANDEPSEAATGDTYDDAFEGEAVNTGSNASAGVSQDPLLDEYDSIYGAEADKQAKAEQKKRQRPSKKSKRNKKSQDSEGDEEFKDDFAKFSISPHLEWADQFSHDNTFGWGLGVFGLYHLSPQFAVGFAISWNRFKETLEYTDINLEISRTAKRWLIGPMARFKLDSFRFDGVLGWDRTNTKFSAKDTSTGEDLVAAAGQAFIGNYNDSAIGINLRAAYAWEFQQRMALEFYLGYGIGLYSGESAVAESKGRTPQQFMLGSAFTFGF